MPVSCRAPEMSFRTLRTPGQVFGFPHRTSFWFPLSDLWVLFCWLLSGPCSSLVSALLTVLLLLLGAGDGLAPGRWSCSRFPAPRPREVVFSWALEDVASCILDRRASALKSPSCVLPVSLVGLVCLHI